MYKKIFSNLKYLIRIYFAIVNKIGFIKTILNGCYGQLVMKDGLKINIRSLVGLKFFNSIFFNKIYGNMEDDKSIIVFDIGANQGYYSMYVLANNRQSFVYSFEPTKKSYLSIKENLAINSLENRCMVIQKGVGGYTRNCYIRTEGRDVDYALCDDINENLDKVECLGINETIEMFRLSTIDVLKMNCEGFEYEILENISVENLKKIKSIRMEYHNIVINGRKQTYRELLNLTQDFKLINHIEMNEKHGIMHLDRIDL